MAARAKRRTSQRAKAPRATSPRPKPARAKSAKPRAKPSRAKTRARREVVGPAASWREDAARVETLARAVARAFEADDLPNARRAFTEYREQILAHLSREEDFAFPDAERRAPAQGGPIRSLRVAHIGIRGDLERVAAHLALGHTGAARAVYQAFQETFAAHERLEDQLIKLLRESP
jgi:hypothetical protein